MIGQPKPLASLSSGLLARKGQARPAMRPQGFAGFASLGGAIEDLGWNDMGQQEAVPQPVPVQDAPVAVAEPVAPAPTLPPVLIDRAALAEEFTPPVEADAEETVEHAAPAPVIDQLSRPRRRAGKAASAKDVAAAPRSGRKAAFTLRLDDDRHLRLRLASALRRQSAQQLVTAALDALLVSMPEVEALAQRSPRSATDLG